jgi:tetratricopeptide (TPR) repeat protein
MRRLLVLIFALALAGAAQNAEEAFSGDFRRAVNLLSEQKYAAAEQAFLQAVKGAERFGLDDGRVGTTLNGLAQAYIGQKKFSEAEAACRRALPIVEDEYGDGSLELAELNFTFGRLWFEQGRTEAALPYLQRTMVTYEDSFGDANPKTAQVLCLIGDTYRASKNFQEAEGPLRKCADIFEKELGLQSAELAEAQHSLALTFQGEGKYAMADARFTLAEKIREGTLGITSPLLAQTMEDHAELLKQMGRTREAARLKTISAAIRRNGRKNR